MGPPPVKRARVASHHPTPILAYITTSLALLAFSYATADICEGTPPCYYGHCRSNETSPLEWQELVCERVALTHTHSPNYSLVIPWPIFRRPRCTQVHATHAISPTECILPISCGESYRHSLDLAWWGKEHNLCVGLGATITHDESGRVELLRHGMPTRMAYVHPLALVEDSPRDDPCPGLYRNLLVARVGNVSHLIDVDSLCNVVAIDPYGRIHMPVPCVETDSEGFTKPVRPTYDMGKHPVRINEFVALPTYKCHHGVATCQTSPNATALRTARGEVFASNRSETCIGPRKVSWGYVPSTGSPYVPQAHVYTAGISFPGLHFLKHLFTYILDGLGHAVSFAYSLVVDASRTINERYRAFEIGIFTGIALWKYPYRRVIVLVVVYVLVCGIRRV